MNLSRSFFISKYLNKKHSANALFLTITFICAVIPVALLLAALLQSEKQESDILLLAALIAGVIILILIVFLIWPSKALPEDLAEDLADTAGTATDDNLSMQLNDLRNEKKYFASVLSHDLRSPLSSIILLASYLKSKEGLTETNQYIELIEQSARKELEMMTTLLSLMRAELINPDNVEEVNLKVLAAEIAADLEQQLSSKALKLNLDIPPDLALTIERQLLTIIFKKLVVQAIRLSDSEQVLQISCRGEGNTVIIKITFINESLSQGVAGQLFMSDHLLEQHSGKPFPDSVSLYFCRKAAEAHNGTIHVEATENTPSNSFILKLHREVPEKIS